MPKALKINAKERVRIIHSCLKEYYSEKYIASKKELRFNLVATLMLAFSGIVALILAFLVDHSIWSEVIDIAAWVFLWEAVDIWFFKNREGRITRKRCLSYIDMRVEYVG